MNRVHDVSAAFDLIIDELNNVVDATNSSGAQALQAGHYDAAQDKIVVAQRLGEFRDQVRELVEKWKKFSLETPRQQVESTEPRASRKVVNDSPKGVEVELEMKGIQAKGIYRKGNFLLLKGSYVSRKEGESLSDPIRERRSELKGKFMLEFIDPHRFRLLQDEVFSSPSAAGMFVVGYAVNGLQTWKMSTTGSSLKQYITP